jgi:hypothetical protein
MSSFLREGGASGTANTKNDSDVEPTTFTPVKREDQQQLQRKAKKQKVDDGEEENDEEEEAEDEDDDDDEEEEDAIILKFFNTLDMFDHAMQREKRLKMIKKYPFLLSAKCPEDIELENGQIDEGSTALEACCDSDVVNPESYEIITDLVAHGAKATPTAYGNLREVLGGVHVDPSFCLILSGNIDGLYLDGLVEDLDEYDEDVDSGKRTSLDLLRIFYKLVKVGDCVGDNTVNELMVENVKSLPKLKVGVTHTKDGPMAKLMKEYPVKKLKELMSNKK